MVDSIPPAGMPINQYPPIVRTAGQSKIIDLLKAINDLTVSRAETKALVDKKFNASEMFFLAHFEMTPFETMIERLLYDPTKKYKGLKSGSSEIRALATTIMAYKAPAPPPHLRLEQMIVILSGMVKYEDATIQIAKYRKELVEQSVTSLLKLESPLPAQVIEVNNSGVLTAPGKIKSTNPAAWINNNILNDLIDYPYLGVKRNTMGKALANILRRAPYSMLYNKIHKDFANKEGVLLSPFLTFHFKSILDEGTPVGYWSHIAKYRLVPVAVEGGKTQVHLVEVNPHTGAPFQRGRVVAEVRKSPSDALSVVAKYYPNVLELKPNINPTLNKSVNISYQTSKLDESAQVWKNTGNKGARYFVNIVETTWNWPDVELRKEGKWFNAFSTKTAPNANRTPQQQLLLDFNSDDSNRRAAALTAGNPPASIQHLVYGSTDPVVMANTFPVSASKFYLLPVGVEEALERICSVKGANVVVDYAKKSLGAHVSTGNARYDYVSSLTQTRFADKLNEMREEMKILGAALTSPYLFTHGYSYVLTGSASERLGMPASTKARNKVREIFAAAKWPSGKPTLLFEAPVNDVSDIQTMRGQFEKALSSTGGKAPPEISIPEMPEMRIQSTAFIDNGVEKVTWQPSPGLGDPFMKGQVDPSRGFYRYFDAGKAKRQWRTLYSYRDLTFARGINTRRRVLESKGVKTFTTTYYEQPKTVSGLSRNTVSNTEMAATLSTIVGAGALALLYAGYRNSKGI